MGTNEREQFVDLLLARAVAAIELARTYLQLADPSAGDHPIDMAGTVWQAPDSLEAVQVAVLRLSGVSWDAIAEPYKITRQSLHRRLSRRADAALEQAKIQRVANAEQLNRTLDRVGVQVRELKALWSREDDFASLAAAVSVWQERARESKWWNV